MTALNPARSRIISKRPAKTAAVANEYGQLGLKGRWPNWLYWPRGRRTRKAIAKKASHSAQRETRNSCHVAANIHDAASDNRPIIAPFHIRQSRRRLSPMVHFQLMLSTECRVEIEVNLAVAARTSSRPHGGVPLQLMIQSASLNERETTAEPGHRLLLGGHTCALHSR